MFGKLKEKLKKVTASISKKFKETEPIVEEVAEEILPKEEFKPPEIREEVKAIAGEEIFQKEELKAPAEEPVEEITGTEEVIEEWVPPKEEFKAPAIEEKPEPVVEEAEKSALIEPEVEKKGGVIKKLKERVVERILRKKVEAPKPEIPIEKIEPKIEEMPKEERIVRKIKEKIVKKVFTKKLSESDLGPILDELETGLIESDVAYEVAKKIKNDLKNSLVDRSIRRGKEEETVVDAMKQSLLEILAVPEIDLENIIKKTKSEGRPAVLIFLGFNGSGKTTSIAKVCKWLKDRGYSCVFAAGDSWRSAAIEQLEEHAKKLKVRVIKHKYGADPAAIIYDGVRHCEAEGVNVLLADTAGRTHTNRNLMEELKKIIRVNKSDLKILVMDSLVGNDAVFQSQMFDEGVGIDAVIFTKNDVNQKGGAILSVSYLLKKPVLFLGIGQEHSDLIDFNSTKFVEQLLSA